MVTVRATPKSARDAIEGIERRGDGIPVLKARVCAAPAEGEANAALTRLLARAASISPSAVTLARGGAGRIKSFHLKGDPAALAGALLAAIGGGRR
jgi:uncharacterized protein YggU (UPF0235/DUF167 family)